MESTSKFEFESAQARLERIIFKLWIVLILLILMLVGTNGAWIYYESQFDVTETTTITQDCDCDSGNAIIYDGVHIGARKADSN